MATAKKNIVKKKKTNNDPNLNPAELVREYAYLKNLSFDEIAIYIRRLNKQYEVEKDSRNLIQMERDKLLTIRQIDIQKIDDMKAQLTLVREELACKELAHVEEIATLKQKVKYLNHEHQAKLNDLRLEMEETNKRKAEEALVEKDKYYKELQQYSAIINEREILREEMITQLTLEYENRISKIRQEYNESLKLTQSIMEARFNDERLQFALITKNAVHEVTELKNKQISDLIQTNAKAYDDLRNYFKDLVNNAMLLVNNLQHKLDADMRNTKEITTKFKALEIEFQEKSNAYNSMMADYIVLKKKSELHMSEKKVFKYKEIELNDFNRKHSKLDIKYQALLNDYEKLKSENDNLRKNIETSSLVFQEKCNNRIFIANQKLEKVLAELNGYKSFLKALKIPINVENFKNKDSENLIKLLDSKKYDLAEIFGIFQLKENVINDLKGRLEFVTRKYNNLIRRLKDTERSVCVPLDELGAEFSQFCETSSNKCLQ